MCQATVYLEQEGQRKKILREVTSLALTEQGVQLMTFFEEPRTIAASVRQIDFLKHTVTLVPLSSEPE